MSKSPENFTALENAVNRLASESVLATVGRDDGLVPAFMAHEEAARFTTRFAAELSASLRSLGIVR